MNRISHLPPILPARAARAAAAVELKRQIAPATATGGLAGKLQTSCQNELRAGLRIIVAGALLVGGWGGFAPLSGAVILQGALVSESHEKKVQHPTGGVVSRVSVRDGDRVEAGAPLLRLDDTAAKANLQVVVGQLDAMRARVARLVAERDGQEMPAALEGDAEQASILAAEKKLFLARQTSRVGQKDLLVGRIGQLQEELRGLDAQMQSQTAQRNLIETELKGVSTLYQKQLVPLARLTALQREAARLDGVQGQLISNAAETRAKMDEARLQVARLDQEFGAEVMKDLRESQDKEAELAERVVAARDSFARLDIRAPASGVVHQLAVHTLGGVVAPGEVLMEIVPDKDELQVEAKLSPRDIDQAHPGEAAQARFPAFNQRTTPEISGRIAFISPDAERDAQGGTFYQVRVTLSREEVGRLGGLKLVAGMPVEVILVTESRTMLSYLFKPISDQLLRMFRER